MQAENQLGGRGWTTQAVESPLEAMSELCLLERRRDSRRAWGHDDHDAPEALALVVVDPRSWPEIDRLVRAARRHLPAASLFELRNGTMSPLGGAGAAAEVVARPPPAASSAPGAAAATGAADTPPQITPEEIAMLLEGNLHEGSQ